MTAPAGVPVPGTEPPALSVVVPVYNGEATLGELVRRLAAVLDPLDGVAGRWELILVNDGSADASWRRIAELAAADARVRGLDLGRNYGQHNALLAGLRAARAPLAATLDDDLQNPPEELPRLLAALGPEGDGGLDVVYGTPERQRHGMWRVVASRLTRWVLAESMGEEAARRVSAFRVLRTRLRDAFADYTGPFVSLDALLTWGSQRFGAVTVRHDRRERGRSGYSLRRLIRHALDLVTGFSTLPLRLASLMGLALALFGAGVLAYVVVGYLVRGGSVPGFPFLASIIAIFSGAQLLALGVLGEYLGRIYFRTLRRPAYTVRRTTPATAAGAERESP